MVTTEPAVNADLTFDQLAAAAEKLTHVEQARLREMLTGWMKARMDELSQELLRKGIISSIPKPRDPNQPRMERRLIQVEGEPLSETIIRERR